MNRRRISVALVAATTTLFALVAPAQAQEPGTEPVPAPEQQVREEDEQSGEDGSSFMGPMDLVRSISSGNGSSGVPEDEDVADEEEEEESLIPESLQLPLAVITALLSVGATVTQVAAVVLPIIPGGVDMLRDLLTGLGIEVPSDNA